MKKKRILVQWIGHSDLRSMAKDLPKSKQDKVLKIVKYLLLESEGFGPAKTLLNTQTFDKCILLTNYPSLINDFYQEWVEKAGFSLVDGIEFVAVKLEKVTNYGEIYKIADDLLFNLKKRKELENTELCINLSPGTPAMAAVWVLLGKTRYPARFYETYNDKSIDVNIPFDLTIDVIPEILKNPDYFIQHLFSNTPSEVEGFQDIIGNSHAIRNAVGRASSVATTGINVLLLGESGTGKEMFAQAIHKASSRRNQKFLWINCAAIPRNLFESELFGHKKGSFTGADKNRTGAFEEADGGTLFLDEIGECDLESQAKLLRVLQPLAGEKLTKRTFRQIGENIDRYADVRIVAATNRDLFKEIESGRFREDLYYRLSSISIKLPALRDRKSDIPDIAENIMKQINNSLKSEGPVLINKYLSDSAKKFIKKHGWPGNIRQLYNTLLQAAALAKNAELNQSDVILALGDFLDNKRPIDAYLDESIGEGFDIDEFLNKIHTHYLQKAIDESNGRIVEAAGLLGIKNYQTLGARLRKNGLKINKKS